MAPQQAQSGNKHVSMRYNMQISASVPLVTLGRSQSMGGKDVGLESLDKAELHGKIFVFLQKTL